MIAPADKKFVGIPWKDGGSSINGVNCAGLALLFLDCGTAGTPQPTAPSQPPPKLEEFLRAHNLTRQMRRGDVVFFRHRARGYWHVATFLGPHQLLHVLQGCKSRVDASFELLRRLGHHDREKAAIDRVD